MRTTRWLAAAGTILAWTTVWVFGLPAPATSAPLRHQRSDVNGDGKDDIVAFSRGQNPAVWASTSNGRAFVEDAWKWQSNFAAGAEHATTGDFNGDGFADGITFTQGTTNDVKVVLNTIGEFGPVQKWHDSFCLAGEIPHVGDFNGDGKDDVVTFTRGSAADVFVAISDGVKFVGTGSKWHDYFSVGGEMPLVGDFNGDGMDDIVTFTRGTSADVWVATSTRTGFGPSKKWHDYFSTGVDIPAVGDFNGDGKDDIATFTRGASHQVWVALSNGQGFNASKNWHNSFGLNDEIPGVGDFNGDGKSDIVTFTRSARGDVYVATSDGAKFNGSGAKWHDHFAINDEWPRPSQAGLPDTLGEPTPLLLVHGYSDTCAAFDDKDPVTPGGTPASARAFLAGRGFSKILRVGYYDPDFVVRPNYQDPARVYSRWDDTPYCDVNVRTADRISRCNTTNQTPEELKYVNARLHALSCMFAWYVYETYTSRNKRVDILAHSMGGLLARGAIAFSGAGIAGYSTSTLLIGHVVTVGTPHGGLYGMHGAEYVLLYASQQISDMMVCETWPTSSCRIKPPGQDQTAEWITGPFMQRLIQMGKPKGRDNAYWALMGSGSPCLNGADGQSLMSCVNALAPTNAHPYTSTDGVVATDSMLAMPADHKILYGALDGTTQTGYNSGGVQYGHEANTCVDLTAQ